MTNIKYNDYYVYAHYLEGEDIPFYIGCGRGSRAFANGSRRNSIWSRIIEGKNYRVVKLKTNLTKDEALEEELKLQRIHQPVACLMYGREFSQSTRDKISQAMLGIIPWNKGLTGFAVSESTRLKMSLKRAGAGNPRAKSVVNCRGEVFSTTKEAAKAFNIRSKSHISAVCKGTRNSCGKYLDGTPVKWYYYKD